MGMLMIKCPKTGSAISTGIQMDQPTFNNMPVFFARTLCPICQTQHQWFARSAWVREPKTRADHPINVARTNRQPSTATMHELKWMVVTIFAAAGLVASFVAGTAVVDASPVSGGAVGRAPFSTVAHKSITYAIVSSEINRTAKGNRLPALISNDQIGVATERAAQDWEDRSVQNSASNEGKRKPVAHCEPVVSPMADPAILHTPRRCFARLGTLQQYSLADSVAAGLLTGRV
jgi:hypothetical protein